MILKARILIARLIDRLYPGVCWVDLVRWAYGFIPWEYVDFSGACSELGEFDPKMGGCYCNKFHLEE